MQSESTLNQLRNQLPEGQLPSSYGVYFKNTLVALCHALEDHILQNRQIETIYQPLVLVTFQQGKWYIQEADRYWDLAQYSRQVAIAAVADSGFATHRTSQLANVDLIHLNPEDSLVEEWNLIIFAPDYAAMVLCHELALDEYKAGSQPQIDTERKFYGLWTFDKILVEKTCQILIDRMRPYHEGLAQQWTNILNEIRETPPSSNVDLSGVVSRIVSYLQSNQQELVTVNRQARELRDLEGQALKLNRNLTASKLQAFLRMAQKVDENDPCNPYASLQVAALAETLGQILDLPTIRLRRLRLAGLLFRIGLASAPAEIFSQNPDKLTPATFKFFKDRSISASRLLDSMPELKPINLIIFHQLEFWDGSGTPDGLKGEEIPLESRILGLVSYFQGLTQPRGDRPAYNLSDALEKCQQYSETRFDPNLLESLKTVIRLTEMGLMQLPDRPSQLPPVWLEETK